jgi:hypothetical protein
MFRRKLSLGFVDHPSLTYATLQSVTKIIPLAIENLVAPEAGAKHELLFNKPASGTLVPISA